MSNMKSVDLLSFQEFPHESSNDNQTARIDVEAVHGPNDFDSYQSRSSPYSNEMSRPIEEPQEVNPGNHNFWSIKYYQKYFDVQTTDVIERIISSIVPQKMSPNFFDERIRGKPDLYGPIWISITLIFVIGISGNIASYLKNENGSNKWRYDFHLISYAATAIVCYVWIVPLALWAALKATITSEDSENIVDEQSSTPSMTSLLCLYGYSLSIYIPVCILWTIQVSWLQWFLVMMAACVSGAVLIFWLLPALRKSKYFLILVGCILLFHFLLATGFMLYFFHASPSHVSVTTTTTVSPKVGS